MPVSKDLINVDDPKSIIAFLKDPFKMSEALSGLLASSADERNLIAGRLVQASIKHKFFIQLGRELQDLAKKGQIKEDYYATNKRQASLCELLKFIDDEVPDEERFKAMKSIFFMGLAKDATEADEILAYELMQICKKLTSNDILVLKACYDIKTGKECKLSGANLKTSHRNEWLKIVSYQIGHKLIPLALISEERLIELKLISGPTYADGSGVSATDFRLTELGIKMCEFITHYQ